MKKPILTPPQRWLPALLLGAAAAMTVSASPKAEGRGSTYTTNYSDSISPTDTLLDDDWAALQALSADLAGRGVDVPWSMAERPTESNYYLGITQGRITHIDLSHLDIGGTLPMALLQFPALTDLNISHCSLQGDLPATVAAWVEQNPGSASMLQSVNISDNAFTGNLGVLGATLPGLRSLYADRNGFSDVVPALPERLNSFSAIDQSLDITLHINLKDYSAGEAMQMALASLPTLPLYHCLDKTYGTYVYVDASNYPVDDDYYPHDDACTMSYYYNYGNTSSRNSGRDIYRGQSGDTLYAAIGSVGTSVYARAVLLFKEGDSNLDGEVDAADLQADIVYIGRGYSDTPFSFVAANLYADSTVNVQDMVCMVNRLLEGETNNKAERRAATAGHRTRLSGTDAGTDTPAATLFVRDGEIVLRTDQPVAAMSLHTDGDVNWNSNIYGLTLATRRNSLVAYSLTQATIPAGETVLGTCSDDCSILSASLSDIKAQRIAVDTTPATGIDHNIAEPDHSPTTIHSLSGTRTGKPQPGVNIIRQQGRTTKVIMK